MLLRLYSHITLLCLSATLSGGLFAQSLSLQEALDRTLSMDPELKRQQLQVTIAEGNLHIAQSTFDIGLTGSFGYNQSSEFVFTDESVYTTYGLNEFRTQNRYSGLGLQKTFGSGLYLRPGVDLLRYRSNLPVPGTGENSPVLSLYGQQPLLKGRGNRSAAARRTEAEKQLDAAIADNQYLVTYRALNTLLRYWEYRAAWEQLGIYRENEARVERMLEVTRSLVEAEHQPQADLVQVEADLAEKSAQRIEAERSLYEARLNLARAMGLKLEDLAEGTEPSSELPLPGAEEVFPELSWLREGAEYRRADVLAADSRSEGAEALYEGLRRDRLPRLDLGVLAESGNRNRGDLVGDYVLPVSGEGGPYYYLEASLSLTLPVQNRYARGSYEVAEAELRDFEIYRDNLVRNLQLNIGIAINDLRATAEALRMAKASLDGYTLAFENEKEKFRNGLTTQLNLILFQERLTAAGIRYINARYRYAVSLSVLRFESGMLTYPGNSGQLRPEAELISIPQK